MCELNVNMSELILQFKSDIMKQKIHKDTLCIIIIMLVCYICNSISLKVNVYNVLVHTNVN